MMCSDCGYVSGLKRDIQMKICKENLIVNGQSVWNDARLVSREWYLVLKSLVISHFVFFTGQVLYLENEEQ